MSVAALPPHPSQTLSSVTADSHTGTRIGRDGERKNNVNRWLGREGEWEKERVRERQRERIQFNTV